VSVDLVYKDATEEDLPAIVEIYNSTVAGRMVTADTEEVTVESKQKWFDAHSEVRPVKMISASDQIIGWLSFNDFYGRPAYKGTAEISIYLHPSHRNKGYGSRVLKDGISFCTSLKIKKLLAFIFAHNIQSIRLFQKNGFAEWGHLPDVAEMDGRSYSLKILGLHIK
jgi:phosphinothricin acetyltransferase